MAETTAEVIYSGADSAAITSATSASGNAAVAGEVALFMLFAGHIFADIGPKDWAIEFSSKLGEMDDDERHRFLISPNASGVEVISHVAPGEARAGFAAWLLHEDEVRPGFFLLADQRHWRLKIRVRGRARFRSYHYFTSSVALLLHHLVLTNSHDPTQQERLFEAARLVGVLHRDGRLRLPIEWSREVTVAAEYMFGKGVVRE